MTMSWLQIITCKCKNGCPTISIDLVFHSKQIGGWSSEGLTVIKNRSTKTSVTCLTEHLTSFAVLVSIQDERPVRK